MATQKQIFSKMKNGLGSANQTVPGLVQTLQNYAGELENASGGGGGGSTVTFTQKATSGGECGTITIDGDSTKIYAPTPAASAVSYVNTSSGLTADDVQEAIDEIVRNTGDLDDLTTTAKTSLVAAINEAAQSGGGGKTLKRTVNTDGTSTYSQIFNQFAADLADITNDAYIVYDTVTSKLIYRVSRILATSADFYYVYMDTTDIDMNSIQISTSSKYSTSHNGTVSDASTQTPAAGRSYSLYV